MQPFGSPTLSDQALMPFPSFKLGPGDSSRSHSADEYIKIWNIDDSLAHKARAKRIPIILGIVVGGYRSTKDNLSIEEWNSFIDRLSKDDFVDKLFSKENTKNVLPYYKLLGALIKGDHKILLKRTIDIQGFLSKKR